MARILITGIGGFIGRVLARALLARGDEVHGIDRIRHPSLPEPVCFVQADLAREETCPDLPGNLDGIIHLAGVSRAGDACRAPVPAMNANIQGSANLLDRAARATPRPWLILGSTREVDRLLKKQTLPSLQDIYALSKQTMESIAIAFAREGGNRLLILRLSDVYGSPEEPEGKLLPTFIRRARDNQPLLIHPGSLGVFFHFTHIDDVLRVVLEGIDRLSATTTPLLALQRVWDESQPIDSTHLARLIQTIGTSASPITLPPPVVSRSSAIEPSIEEIPFIPTITLAEGIRRQFARFC
ncbi:MAG: NAD(P)-dependent oxidoreductase [Magnetococcales bacterium]|nr:NAD(P)-dependent oxidoreductase [Magnetococcales bacterium]